MASTANTSSGDTRANKYADICAAEAVRCMILNMLRPNKVHLMLKQWFNCIRKAAETIFSGLAPPLVADFQITMNQNRLCDGLELACICEIPGKPNVFH